MNKQVIELEKTVYFTQQMADESYRSARATGVAAAAAKKSADALPVVEW